MQNQRTIVFFFAYLALAIATLVTVRADEPSQTRAAVPDGTPSQISDWALAGVIWSDASLTQRLAVEAAKQAETQTQAEELRTIARQSAQLIEALEAFGWRHVQRTTRQTSSESAGVRDGESEMKALPDPEAVGEAIAGSLDPLVGNQASAAATRAAKQREKRRDVAANRGVKTATERLKRFDTETPAGRDDPGLDDELTSPGTPLDVAPYRVDDYIDETSSESRNRADAIEDGVEGAIAAAAGQRGLQRPASDRISKREVMTRSATLPFAEDSIYDSNDFDPDVDYNVNNPRPLDPAKKEGYTLGDRDDDINLNDPAAVIDGEDEFIANTARRSAADEAATEPTTATQINLDRYTGQRNEHLSDANWVQFHLEANQAVWRQFTNPDNVVRRANDAVIKLKADVSVAKRATNDPRLRKILDVIAD
ncbi:hypothetical protein SH528x_004892 [Novipirellula sp. SH528]|uniref:hypothetical protein n=1 Tax=Novipirellula sp. SH528 TaxID=3454466 RepID=UPI003FA12BAA